MTTSTQNALHSLDVLETALKEAGLVRHLPLVDSVRKCMTGIVAQHGLLSRIKSLAGVSIRTGAARRQICEFDLMPFALGGHNADCSDQIVYGEPDTIARLRVDLAELSEFRRQKGESDYQKQKENTEWPMNSSSS